ncbi:MAG TPA: hypothetical protein ENI72_00295 [Rhodospirillales bacterium]|nr:hypothetical protein [Rhodospirillales bacterium]
MSVLDEFCFSTLNDCAERTATLGVLSAPWIVSQLPDPLKEGNAAASLSHSLQHRIVIWKTATA